MIAYLKARLEEKTTWTGIGAAVTAGAAVPSPFCYAIILAGIIAILAPR